MLRISILFFCLATLPCLVEAQRLDVGINGGFAYQKSNIKNKAGKFSNSFHVDRVNFIGGNVDLKTKWFLHRMNFQFEKLRAVKSNNVINNLEGFNIQSSTEIKQSYMGTNYTFGVKPFKSVGIYPTLGFSALHSLGGNIIDKYDAEIEYPPTSEHTYSDNKFKSNTRYILSPGILLWQPVGSIFGFEILIGYRLPLNRIHFSNTSFRLRGLYIEFGLTVKVFDKFAKEKEDK